MEGSGSPASSNFSPSTSPQQPRDTTETLSHRDLRKRPYLLDKDCPRASFCTSFCLLKSDLCSHELGLLFICPQPTWSVRCQSPGSHRLNFATVSVMRLGQMDKGPLNYSKSLHTHAKFSPITTLHS